MEITRQLLKDLRPQIDNALLGLAEKYGIQMSIGSGKYGGLDGHFKLLLSTAGENGETKESRDWNISCTYFGMNKDWLGETIEVNGVPYKITGLKPNRSKYPIAVTRVSDDKKQILTTRGTRVAMLRQGYKIPQYYDDNLGPKDGNVPWLKP